MLSVKSREENEQSGRSAAAEARKTHGLGFAPISDLPSFIEEAERLDVRITDLPTGVDALTVQSGPEGRILIGVAITDNPERQRFSLAHELGHARFGDLLVATEVGDPDPETEDRAHCFARHFLIPEDGIKHRLSELNAGDGTLTRRHLSVLVQHFGVSPAVATRQLHQMGLIDEEQIEDWRDASAAQLAVEYGWDAERAARVHKALTKRLPQRIAARAARAYSSGSLTLVRLGQLRRDEDLSATRHWVDASGLKIEMSPMPECIVEIDEL